MVCVSVRKAVRKKYIWLILLILIFSIVNLGCDPYYDKYPYDRASSWISVNPSISLTYKEIENGTVSQEEILVWEEATIEIDLMFRTDFYDAFPANSTAYEDRLFSGSWHYRDDKLILTIEEDFIFSHQFEELVFIPEAEN